MATQLLYLEDFDVCSCQTKITGINPMDDGRSDVQLAATCFYPRGGGQDWDKGTIVDGNGTASFAVEEVRLDEDGIVHHIGVPQTGALQMGDEVRGEVDTKRRTVNTRLHSAGHVIDMAVDALGLSSWVPTKGQHYPDLSAVEYSGQIDPAQAEELRVTLENMANELIAAGSQNTIRFMPVEMMHTVCRHVPSNIPTNKPARVVLYSETFGIPCGGTHVRDIHEIGKMHIPKLKEKKGTIRVSYSVEGIN